MARESRRPRRTFAARMVQREFPLRQIRNQCTSLAGRARSMKPLDLVSRGPRAPEKSLVRVLHDATRVRKARANLRESEVRRNGAGARRRPRSDTQLCDTAVAPPLEQKRSDNRTTGERHATVRARTGRGKTAGGMCRWHRTLNVEVVLRVSSVYKSGRDCAEGTRHHPPPASRKRESLSTTSTSAGVFSLARAR